MVKVETFLKDSNGEFQPVETCRTQPRDLDYIEGAIQLSIDGLPIIGLEEWDYVDQLWCYVADMVTQFGTTGFAETYFPDQPIKLSFQSSGSRVLVTAETGNEVRRASAPSAEFLESVRTAGTRFFEKMSELAPANSYAEAIQQLAN
ncbi:hypothetical protein [Streptomyces glomeratus]|uniref:Uncharacterized protein n=1 Tax=Streptomyces glomeratus TaxID=284452 RepID=A0ABN3Y8I4_9ACTN|nr:hypothetical protein [Streptomyces glomeratus]MCF1509986.1 hypothetical protein [Streptomyces glomeratus]